MKTEQLIADTLKKLMSNESFDRITVQELSSACNIKRQTFYYYFRDIYDLLTWIFLNENTLINKEVKDWKEMVKQIIKYVNKNKNFVKHILESSARDLFEQFVYSYFYSQILRQFVTFDKENKFTSEERKFYVTYYTSAMTSCIILWIDQGMKEKVEDLLNKLEMLNNQFIPGLIK